jgi:ribose 5-phosphate isomerase A
MLSATEIKRNVGQVAAGLIQSGMTVGLGTGTTANFFVEALGEKVRSGLAIQGVPTSVATRKLARDQSIPLLEFNEALEIDVAVDGADEIDPGLSLIKGGGGALLQEKMVDSFSKRLIVIADSRKWVPILGAFPLAIEVVPFGWKHIQNNISHQKKILCALRQKDGKPFLTDQKNYILDCFFNSIPEPEGIHEWLIQIPGVVETGLFVRKAHTALIGFPDGSVKTFTPKGKD